MWRRWIIITRKDKIREGYVSRNFHIPIEVDDQLRMEANKQRIRFSDIAIAAFRQYLQRVDRLVSERVER